jgi:hypothetical protein
MALTMSGRDVTIAKPEDGSPWLQLPVQQFHYHSFLSDHGTECIIVPEHGPMNWWNLKRLDLQLRELGLAPPNDSTIVGTAATSTSSASLDGEDLDAWSTFPSADRHVVFRIDDGAKQ